MILGLPFTEEEKRIFTAKNLYGDNGTPWELLTDDLPWHKVLNSNRDIGSQKVIYVFTFLTKAAKKNSNHSKNRNRVAGCGTWNVNSSAKPVRDNCGFGRKIGESKNFTFESAEQTVGQWTMTEYSIDAAANGIPEVQGINYSDYVLCKIKRDDSKSSKGGRIVSRKRKNENLLREQAGQNLKKKKMQSVSRNEDSSVWTGEETLLNNEEAGISCRSYSCGNGAPLLMNLGDSDMVATDNEQSSGKMMEAVSSCEDLSVVTCCDDNGAMDLCNDEGTGDNGVPLLINEVDPDDVATAASPSTCWNIPLDEPFLDDPSFFDFNIDSFLNQMVECN
ncbi:OLC1v1012373C2 [Oldenlandia corymbosa var. corymbosa]|nr:OLC1v1012373C2 [Oldenlandia corymbosa var. corymbosa]